MLSGEWDLTAQLRVPASSKTQVCAPACVWGPCNVISLIAVLVRDSMCEHRGGACAYICCVQLSFVEVMLWFTLCREVHAGGGGGG